MKLFDCLAPGCILLIAAEFNTGSLSTKAENVSWGQLSTGSLLQFINITISKKKRSLVRNFSVNLN